MEVVFSKTVTFDYACAELRQGLTAAMPTIVEVAKEFETHKDRRRLFVRLACDCCYGHSDRRPSDVEVSPLHGSGEHDIEVYPPFRRPGHGSEAATVEEFGNKFRELIKRRLDPLA